VRAQAVEPADGEGSRQAGDGEQGADDVGTHNLYGSPHTQRAPPGRGGWAERGSVSIFQQKRLATGCTRPAFG
jgi:hypothetical protein